MAVFLYLLLPALLYEQAAVSFCLGDTQALQHFSKTLGQESKLIQMKICM